MLRWVWQSVHSAIVLTRYSPRSTVGPVGLIFAGSALGPIGSIRNAMTTLPRKLRSWGGTSFGTGGWERRNEISAGNWHSARGRRPDSGPWR